MSDFLRETPGVACIMGALVADAASRGLHWLYDPARLREIAARQGGRLAFTRVDPENFAGAKGVLVHAAEPNGAQTQYGEVLLVALAVLAEGAFDVARYQVLYAETFGAGGSYQGYIDRPTRGTLANLAAERVAPSGIEDDQLPAIATLPAIAGRFAGTSDFAAIVERAITVTNTHEDALAYGQLVARIMAEVVRGAEVGAALLSAVEVAPLELQAMLRDALETEEADAVAYGEKTGRACHLPMAVPLSFHILARAKSYAEAIEINLAVGGDSAGRAILIGGVMGAAHGFGAPDGIPLRWLLATRDAEGALALAQSVCV